ncbi:MAG: zinc-ribbon domain-containing protein [Anaerolineae bacterium]|nr:zinc-ribbon domain-containing protein [Anaerolineae bacterium]
MNPWDFLANVTIALLMLAIPLSHVAWLVMAAIWLARSSEEEPSPAGEALNCPHCGDEVRLGWKACPYCGERLEGVSGEK